MESRDAWIALRNPYCYMPNGQDIARVVGVNMMKLDGYDMRPCYLIRYPNGEEDSVAFEDSTFTIGTFEDVVKLSNWIPERLCQKY